MMGNLAGKGYGNRGSVFTFLLPSGEKEVYSSNAYRYEDAIAKAGLPEGTKLVDSTSFGLFDGSHNDVNQVDFIWTIKGSLPSGKDVVEYLIDVGAITEEQAKKVLEANEVGL